MSFNHFVTKLAAWVGLLLIHNTLFSPLVIMLRMDKPFDFSFIKLQNIKAIWSISLCTFSNYCFWSKIVFLDEWPFSQHKAHFTAYQLELTSSEGLLASFGHFVLNQVRLWDTESIFFLNYTTAENPHPVKMLCNYVN